MSTALPATLIDAVAAIAAGRLSASELAEEELARIARTDGAVEAWESLDPAHVRREAARCDREAVTGPLAGIGIGVKDIIDTRDFDTAMGSPIYAGHRPTADAPCVARLRAAGAYVFGKTVTTPFAFMDPGKTRNPWHREHSPGGSSSGSAAAVAAGQVLAAIGTQTNGSVVRPAAYCGVVGFKPTLHAIPYAGAHLFSAQFDTLGTFTRTVADAARLASVLADPGRIAPVEKSKPAAAPAPVAAPVPKPRKLSYKEQRELDELPQRIEALEAEQKALDELLADPDAYVKDPQRMAQANKRHAQIDEELLAALERWEALGTK